MNVPITMTGAKLEIDPVGSGWWFAVVNPFRLTT
jgi:hypothetical protein